MSEFVEESLVDEFYHDANEYEEIGELHAPELNKAIVGRIDSRYSKNRKVSMLCPDSDRLIFTYFSDSTVTDWDIRERTEDYDVKERHCFVGHNFLTIYDSESGNFLNLNPRDMLKALLKPWPQGGLGALEVEVTNKATYELSAMEYNDLISNLKYVVYIDGAFYIFSRINDKTTIFTLDPDTLEVQSYLPRSVYDVLGDVDICSKPIAKNGKIFIQGRTKEGNAVTYAIDPLIDTEIKPLDIYKLLGDSPRAKGYIEMLYRPDNGLIYYICSEGTNYNTMDSNLVSDQIVIYDPVKDALTDDKHQTNNGDVKRTTGARCIQSYYNEDAAKAHALYSPLFVLLYNNGTVMTVFVGGEWALDKSNIGSTDVRFLLFDGNMKPTSFKISYRDNIKFITFMGYDEKGTQKYISMPLSSLYADNNIHKNDGDFTDDPGDYSQYPDGLVVTGMGTSPNGMYDVMFGSYNDNGITKPLIKTVNTNPLFGNDFFHGLEPDTGISKVQGFGFGDTKMAQVHLTPSLSEDDDEKLFMRESSNAIDDKEYTKGDFLWKALYDTGMPYNTHVRTIGRIIIDGKDVPIEFAMITPPDSSDKAGSVLLSFDKLFDISSLDSKFAKFGNSLYPGILFRNNTGFLNDAIISNVYSVDGSFCYDHTSKGEIFGGLYNDGDYAKSLSLNITASCIYRNDKTEDEYLILASKYGYIASFNIKTGGFTNCFGYSIGENAPKFFRCPDRKVWFDEGDVVLLTVYDNKIYFVTANGSLYELSKKESSVDEDNCIAKSELTECGKCNTKTQVAKYNNVIALAINKLEKDNIYIYTIDLNTGRLTTDKSTVQNPPKALSNMVSVGKDMYYVDKDANLIKYNTSSKCWKVVYTLTSPEAILAYDYADRIYIASSGSVYKYTISECTLDLVGDLAYPSAMVYYGKYLWIIDTKYKRLRKVSTENASIEESLSCYANNDGRFIFSPEKGILTIFGDFSCDEIDLNTKRNKKTATAVSLGLKPFDIPLHFTKEQRYDLNSKSYGVGEFEVDGYDLSDTPLMWDVVRYIDDPYADVYENKFIAWVLPGESTTTPQYEVKGKMYHEFTEADKEISITTDSITAYALYETYGRVKVTWKQLIEMVDAPELGETFVFRYYGIPGLNRKPTEEDLLEETELDEEIIIPCMAEEYKFHTRANICAANDGGAIIYENDAGKLMVATSLKEVDVANSNYNTLGVLDKFAYVIKDDGVDLTWLRPSNRETFESKSFAKKFDYDGSTYISAIGFIPNGQTLIISWSDGGLGSIFIPTMEYYPPDWGKKYVRTVEEVIFVEHEEGKTLGELLSKLDTSKNGYQFVYYAAHGTQRPLTDEELAVSEFDTIKVSAIYKDNDELYLNRSLLRIFAKPGEILDEGAINIETVGEDIYLETPTKSIRWAHEIGCFFSGNDHLVTGQAVGVTNKDLNNTPITKLGMVDSGKLSVGKYVLYIGGYDPTNAVPSTTIHTGIMVYDTEANEYSVMYTGEDNLHGLLRARIKPFVYLHNNYIYVFGGLERVDERIGSTQYSTARRTNTIERIDLETGEITTLKATYGLPNPIVERVDNGDGSQNDKYADCGQSEVRILTPTDDNKLVGYINLGSDKDNRPEINKDKDHKGSDLGQLNGEYTFDLVTNVATFKPAKGKVEENYECIVSYKLTENQYLKIAKEEHNNIRFILSGTIEDETLSLRLAGEPSFINPIKVDNTHFLFGILDSKNLSFYKMVIDLTEDIGDSKRINYAKSKSRYNEENKIFGNSFSQFIEIDGKYMFDVAPEINPSGPDAGLIYHHMIIDDLNKFISRTDNKKYIAGPHFIIDGNEILFQVKENVVSNTIISEDGISSIENEIPVEGITENTDIRLVKQDDGIITAFCSENKKLIAILSYNISTHTLINRQIVGNLEDILWDTTVFPDYDKSHNAIYALSGDGSRIWIFRGVSVNAIDSGSLISIDSNETDFDEDCVARGIYACENDYITLYSISQAATGITVKQYKKESGGNLATLISEVFLKVKLTAVPGSFIYRRGSSIIVVYNGANFTYVNGDETNTISAFHSWKDISELKANGVSFMANDGDENTIGIGSDKIVSCGNAILVKSDAHAKRHFMNVAEHYIFTISDREFGVIDRETHEIKVKDFLSTFISENDTILNLSSTHDTPIIITTKDIYVIDLDKLEAKSCSKLDDELMIKLNLTEETIIKSVSVDDTLYFTVGKYLYTFDGEYVKLLTEDLPYGYMLDIKYIPTLNSLQFVTFNLDHKSYSVSSLNLDSLEVRKTIFTNKLDEQYDEPEKIKGKFINTGNLYIPPIVLDENANIHIAAGNCSKLDGVNYHKGFIDGASYSVKLDFNDDIGSYDGNHVLEAFATQNYMYTLEYNTINNSICVVKSNVTGNEYKAPVIDDTLSIISSSKIFYYEGNYYGFGIFGIKGVSIFNKVTKKFEAYSNDENLDLREFEYAHVIHSSGTVYFAKTGENKAYVTAFKIHTNKVLYAKIYRLTVNIWYNTFCGTPLWTSHYVIIPYKMHSRTDYSTIETAIIIDLTSDDNIILDPEKTKDISQDSRLEVFNGIVINNYKNIIATYSGTDLETNKSDAYLELDEIACIIKSGKRALLSSKSGYLETDMNRPGLFSGYDPKVKTDLVINSNTKFIIPTKDNIVIHPRTEVDEVLDEYNVAEVNPQVIALPPSPIRVFEKNGFLVKIYSGSTCDIFSSTDASGKVISVVKVEREYGVSIRDVLVYDESRILYTYSDCPFVSTMFVDAETGDITVKKYDNTVYGSNINTGSNIHTIQEVDFTLLFDADMDEKMFREKTL